MGFTWNTVLRQERFLNSEADVAQKKKSKQQHTTTTKHKEALINREKDCVEVLLVTQVGGSYLILLATLIIDNSKSTIICQTGFNVNYPF